MTVVYCASVVMYHPDTYSLGGKIQVKDGTIQMKNVLLY